MAKLMQNFKLYTLLKEGNPVTKEEIAKELGVAVISVPVYIHEMKDQFKAKIESVKDGRKVLAYKLTNAAELDVPEHRVNTNKVKAVTHTTEQAKETKDEEEPRHDLDERELSDLRDQLGVSAMGYGRGGGFGGSDW